MILTLTIDSKPLTIEIDDVIAGLLAARLNVPSLADHQGEVSRYLSEAGGPWILDENHMRKRVMRRLILEIADPALVVRYLMLDQAE
ncbi:hypothetical protein [Paraburkholderia sp.]|uniref:hypothetical protein n=1 Tax=Paraburkholderia sp. TaxID=1926495 RepID=UPI0039E28D49